MEINVATPTSARKMCASYEITQNPRVWPTRENDERHYREPCCKVMVWPRCYGFSGAEGFSEDLQSSWETWGLDFSDFGDSAMGVQKMGVSPFLSIRKVTANLLVEKGQHEKSLTTVLHCSFIHFMWHRKLQNEDLKTLVGYTVFNDYIYLYERERKGELTGSWIGK